MAQPGSCFDSSEKANYKCLYKNIGTCYINTWLSQSIPQRQLPQQSALSAQETKLKIPFPCFIPCVPVCKPMSRKEMIKGRGLGNALRLALLSWAWIGVRFSLCPFKGICLWGRMRMRANEPTRVCLPECSLLGLIEQRSHMDQCVLVLVLSWLTSYDYVLFQSFHLRTERAKVSVCFVFSDWTFDASRLLSLTRSPMIIFINGERTKHWQKWGDRNTEWIRASTPSSGV